MHRLRSPSARRIPALIVCLALFLVGSNYCLLGAWGGNTRMACMTGLRDAVAATPAPQCQHCAPAGKHSRAGDANAARSCCPDPVVTPSTPSLEKGGALAGPSSAAFLAVAPAPTPLFTSAWPGRSALSDGQPPARLARGPLSARAPPLA